MFFKTIDFSRYSSIKVGQPTQVMMIEKEDTIPKDRYIIGGANNLLLSPTPPPLMMLSKDFAYIKEYDNLLEIGASMPSGRVVSYAKRHNLAGFEFMAKLPGQLGGLVAMNAGVKEYEIFNIIHSIQIENQWISKNDIEYGYRYAKLNGVVTAVRFDIRYRYDYMLEESLNKLRANQPSTPSAGSAFKNPPNDSAGRVIDAVGLKGYKQGGMAWSDIHANFLVNIGGGNLKMLYIYSN
jgi:UDP-N-acetylmuramate dehydrogenase